ncbi:GDSL-type esterase/lipase family protein [uncultured Pseudodesulfovibrio sp.]|uniref:GDSL-type esterase/lipase family protein n=1 Tax=uncultured Pseudodesulfovibrio sp. TaxID=2035858 RepID=UPI0029C7C89B|nr:GDSL-type esterase/lipase family protein [uncultured Pseudodesulfovibrio sp.]
MKDRPIRIACFGDSLTEGYGLSPDEALPIVLERMLLDEGIQTDCLNFGVSGDTFEDGLTRIHAMLAARPDLVILEFGANDSFMAYPAESIMATATAVIEIILKQNLPILLVGITALPDMGMEYKHHFDPIFPALAKKFKLPLFPDILSSYFGDSALTLLDGMHPNAGGVEAITRSLLPHIRELINTVQTRN